MNENLSYTAAKDGPTTYLATQPDLMASAAADLEEIRSAIGAANSAAAGRTTSLVAAARDEVSAASAALFNSYAAEYQAVVAQASSFHEHIVGLLAGSGLAYAETEIANAASSELGALSAPFRSLLGGSGGGANPAAGITNLVLGAFASDITTMASSPASFSPASMTSALGSSVAAGSALLPATASALSSPASFISSVQGTNAFLANAFSGALSSAYATLLPTADIVNALAISMPSYDINLFLGGVEQIVNGDPVNGLITAFGAPVAADTALLTLATGFEFRVFEHAAVSIVDGFIPPTPAPPSTPVSL